MGLALANSESAHALAVVAGERLEKPARIVCHLLREYARPQETFIVNQVAGDHDAYEPFVLCRAQLANTPSSTLASDTEVVSYMGATEQRGPWEVAYRHLRMMSRAEQRFYTSHISRPSVRVVHAHYGTDAGFFLGSVRAADKPLVISYYGYDVSRFPRSYLGLGALYERRVWRYPALHIAMTAQMREDLIRFGVPADSIRVHHHGIDVDFWARSDGCRDASHASYVLMVAGLQPKKGQADLLKAFRLASQSIPGLELHLAGTGSLQHGLEALAAELGIAERVRFLGHVPHGPALLREYANALFFCHPSRTAENGDREGLPGTILEAMACGLAVVATKHAGIPEAVRDGESGILVDEGDVSALAEAIESLVANVAARESYGAAGRRRAVEKFSARVQSRRLEKIYDEAVA